MINDRLFDSMLNLPEVKITSVHIDQSGHCIIRVESRGESTRCHGGDEVRLLAILADRNKAPVKAFFASIPKRLRKTIKVVCSDRYEGFVNAAKEVLGHKVNVVIDRFHVATGYRQG